MPAAVVMGLAGCGSMNSLDSMVPRMEDLMDANRLQYENQNLTAQALADRMKEIDDYYAEPRSFGRLYASYETCLKSISEVNGYAALWRGARACAAISFDEKQTRSTREEFALKGISFAREAVKKSSTLPESFYYHAVCLAALAKTRKDASRDLLHNMRDQMMLAKALDEKYDYCGPLRFLGQLYVDTDPYPAMAVGSLEQGLKYLKDATEKCPEFGENHLAYARVLKKEGEVELARAELEKVMSSPKVKDRTAEHQAWLEEASQLLSDMQGK